MIKAASNQLEFVIRRDYTDQENEEKTHITFKSKEGITIQSKGDILFDTLENFNLVSRPQTLESFVPNHESKSAEMQAHLSPATVTMWAMAVAVQNTQPTQRRTTEPRAKHSTWRWFSSRHRATFLFRRSVV